MMLAYEGENIVEFKERIDHDKKRLETDFSNFTREMVCIIDDLKTSLMAELDLIYKGYIDRYLFLK